MPMSEWRAKLRNMLLAISVFSVHTVNPGSELMLYAIKKVLVPVALIGELIRVVGEVQPGQSCVRLYAGGVQPSLNGCVQVTVLMGRGVIVAKGNQRSHFQHWLRSGWSL